MSCSNLFILLSEVLSELLHSRARRRFKRGLKRKPLALLKKLRKAKKECPALEKPEVVKTHLRNVIIVPEMVGCMVGVYNGKVFNQVEIKVLFFYFSHLGKILCQLSMVFPQSHRD